MSGKKREPEFDEENPEWTEHDFARAKSAHEILPPEALAAFRNTRSLQKSPTKIPVSIRLSPDVIEHFRAMGPGWQGRIDETLRTAISRTKKKRANR